MGYNIINDLFAAPQLTQNQIDIKWAATSSIGVTFFDGTQGSDFPALSGYILVNGGSSASSVIATFLNGTATLSTLDVVKGNYLSFYVMGANNVEIATSASGVAATGDFNLVFSNNPF